MLGRIGVYPCLKMDPIYSYIILSGLVFLALFWFYLSWNEQRTLRKLKEEYEKNPILKPKETPFISAINPSDIEEFKEEIKEEIKEIKEVKKKIKKDKIINSSSPTENMASWPVS